MTRRDVYSDVCPSRVLLDLLANKWSALVIGLLERGPARFSALQSRMEGVSPKMLTQTLRSLERDGLITRTATPTVPVTVDYALTDLGVSLHQTTRQLRAWAQDHMDDVQAHRVEHDEGAV